MKKTIKVLIIDDSALVREVLTNLLETDKSIEVVGTAKDPLYAIAKIKKQQVDVLTLDLQMPRMDGLTFLRKIMQVYPLPIIVISSLTKKGSKETIKALELGALDFVPKPDLGISNGLKEMKQEITSKIKGVVKVNLQNLNNKQVNINYMTKRNLDLRKKVNSTIELIAIGASTGGTIAVRNILQQLPANMPGIIVVLHMPATFTASYAENLNKTCSLRVKEAENGEEFKKGTVYIAPGDKHLILEQGVSGYFFKTDQGPKINHVRPAIDKTFESVANIVAPNCIGVILTGMGKDGVAGLKKMYQRKAYTIAQDEETSVIFAMPGKAIESGVISKVLPLEEIAVELIKSV